MPHSYGVYLRNRARRARLRAPQSVGQCCGQQLLAPSDPALGRDSASMEGDPSAELQFLSALRQRLGSRVADWGRRTDLRRKDTEQQRLLAYPLVRGDPDPVFRSFVSAGFGWQADGEPPCPTCASLTSRRRTSISRSFEVLA